jgi:tRNA 2-thiouridine synthesizing protein A
MNERPDNSAAPPQADAEVAPAADDELDATGLICPEPLMLVRNRVREMRSGQVLHVIATDPTTGRDFRDFCRFMGHTLVAERHAGPTLEYWLRKA